MYVLELSSFKFLQFQHLDSPHYYRRFHSRKIEPLAGIKTSNLMRKFTFMFSPVLKLLQSQHVNGRLSLPQEHQRGKSGRRKSFAFFNLMAITTNGESFSVFCFVWVLSSSKELIILGQRIATLTCNSQTIAKKSHNTHNTNHKKKTTFELDIFCLHFHSHTCRRLLGNSRAFSVRKSPRHPSCFQSWCCHDFYYASRGGGERTKLCIFSNSATSLHYYIAGSDSARRIKM